MITLTKELIQEAAMCSDKAFCNKCKMYEKRQENMTCAQIIAENYIQHIEETEKKENQQAIREKQLLLLFAHSDDPKKLSKFLKITNCDWQKSLYIKKDSDMADKQYYDLLAVFDEKNNPVCIPVPVARMIFDTCITEDDCKHVMPGSVYEFLFGRFYRDKTNKEADLPF